MPRSLPTPSADLVAALEQGWALVRARSEDDLREFLHVYVYDGKRTVACSGFGSACGTVEQRLLLLLQEPERYSIIKPHQYKGQHGNQFMECRACGMPRCSTIHDQELIDALKLRVGDASRRQRHQSQPNGQ